MSSVSSEAELGTVGMAIRGQGCPEGWRHPASLLSLAPSLYPVPQCFYTWCSLHLECHPSPW